MIATAGYVDSRTHPFLRELAGGVEGNPAHTLACAYQDAVDAYWRGETGAPSLEELLPGSHVLSLPSRPRWLPDAVSPCGAGGRGIRWYVVGPEVLGYAPGMPGGYRVPISAILPLASAA